MTNDNCDRKSKCEDYKYNHCDGCNGNKISSEDFIKAFGNGVKPIDVQPVGISNKSSDLIKRNLAIAYAISGLVRRIEGEDWIRTSEVKQSLNDVPTVEPEEIYMTTEDYNLYLEGYKQGKKDFERPQGEWTQITFRPMDDEEYEEFIKYSDCPKEECKVYNCRMPEDGQEVLITTSWGNVCIDIYHIDVDSCFFEDHDDSDDVIAWMPLPKPFEAEVQDGN